MSDTLDLHFNEGEPLKAQDLNTMVDAINNGTGKSLEFLWNGDRLGVRVEGESAYRYSESLKGTPGTNGRNGRDGIDGQDGRDGQDGTNGTNGVSLQFTWSGTRLGIKREDESDYEYVNLKGTPGINGRDGADGQDGADGRDGRDLEFHWEGDQLGVRIAGSGVEYTFSDHLTGPSGQDGSDGQDGADGADGQDGADGADGQDGVGLEFHWDGTRLGVKRVGDANYEYVNLKGQSGADGHDLEFNWNGDQLGVRIAGSGTEYTYSEPLTGPAGTDGINGSDGQDGQDGKDGVGLEYTWDGTSLGIKREDEDSYNYSNLQGLQGERGMSIMPMSWEEWDRWVRDYQRRNPNDEYITDLWYSSAIIYYFDNEYDWDSHANFICMIWDRYRPWTLEHTTVTQQQWEDGRNDFGEYCIGILFSTGMLPVIMPWGDIATFDSSTGEIWCQSNIIGKSGKQGSIEFDVSVVNKLPETGQEHTIYFVPSESDGTSDARAYDSFPGYNDEDDIPTVDINNSIGRFEDLRIGDVFEYLKDDVYDYINFSVGAIDDGEGNISYSRKGVVSTLLYNVGDTFRISNYTPSSDTIIFTSANNPEVYIDDETGDAGINGVTYTTLESNKVYRLTGYHDASLPSGFSDMIGMEVEGLYVVTFVEDNTVVTPDYEISNDIGTIQLRPLNREYSVVSAMSKNNINVRLEQVYDEDADEYVESVQCISGITSTITLQNGHYYKLVDKYFLKANQFSGNEAPTMPMEGIGVEMYVFEEVSNPDVITYEERSFIPTCQIYLGYQYSDSIKFHGPMYATTNTDPDTGDEFTLYNGIDIEAAYTHPIPLLTEGDVLKVIGDNDGYDLGTPFVFANSVDDRKLEAGFDSGDSNVTIHDGIVDTVEWEKNGYYVFTGYHKCSITTSGGRSERLECFVPTFDKPDNVSEADYEVMFMPGIAVSNKPLTNSKEEWMWVNGGWELIGTTKIDLSNYVTSDDLSTTLSSYCTYSSVYTKSETYTQSQVNSLLSSKQDTISDLSTIRTGASKGATALQRTDLDNVLEPITCTISSHINELTERLNAIEDITVEDVIDELNVIDEPVIE